MIDRTAIRRLDRYTRHYHTQPNNLPTTLTPHLPIRGHTTHILHRTDARPNIRFMSNLGPYQEFTTQAKAAGGVHELLDAIKRDAVSEAAPKYEGRGVIVGAIITATAVGIAKFLRNKLQEREQSNRKAKEAEKALHALTDFSPQPTNCGEGIEHDQIDASESTESRSQANCEGTQDADRS